MKESNYKKEMLEGGEGYNPFTKNESAGLDLGEKIYRLQRIMNGTSINDSRYPEMEAQMAKLTAESNAKFASEWTKEVTAARRALWNAWAMEAKTAGRKISQEEFSKKQSELGFSMSDLKKAIALNSL